MAGADDEEVVAGDGDRLRAYLITKTGGRRGWVQKLADAAGVTRQTLSGWMSAEQIDADLGSMRGLARALEVPVTEVIAAIEGTPLEASAIARDGYASALAAQTAAIRDLVNELRSARVPPVVAAMPELGDERVISLDNETLRVRVGYWMTQAKSERKQTPGDRKRLAAAAYLDLVNQLVPLEKGEVAPSMTQLRGIAAFYGRGVEWFLQETPEERDERMAATG